MEMQAPGDTPGPHYAVEIGHVGAARNENDSKNWSHFCLTIVSVSLLNLVYPMVFRLQLVGASRGLSV
jgi:hypothetical protein